MQEILLIRHGEALPYAVGGDAARALTPRGQQSAATLGKTLALRQFSPDEVWHSPYVRATQTAQLLSSELGLAADCLHAKPQLTPEASATRARSLLQERMRRPIRRLIVVSHLPFLPALAAQWLESSESPSIQLNWDPAAVMHIALFGERAVLCGFWQADGPWAAVSVADGSGNVA